MQRLLIALGIWILASPLALAQPPWDWQGGWPESPGVPRLGVLVHELPFGTLDQQDLPYGVRVMRVMPRSAAEAAGIQRDDILLTLDGHPLFSGARLQWLTTKAAPTKHVEFSYVRDGQTRKAQVDLHAATANPTSRPHPRGHTGPSYLGVGLQPLTHGLREALEAPQDAGMLVAEVVEGSPAEQAGLRAGDVITKMDRRPVRSMGDVWRVLDYVQPGEKLAVEFVRDKNIEQLSVTVGERERIYGGWPSQRAPHPEDRPFMTDPAWWREMGDLMEHWRQYLENRPQWSPQGAL